MLVLMLLNVNPQMVEDTQHHGLMSVLMHLKSPKLYRKMRMDNIMPLPSYATLLRYIRKLRPVYGFSQTTIKILGMKSANMSSYERHGIVNK